MVCERPSSKKKETISQVYLDTTMLKFIKNHLKLFIVSWTVFCRLLDWFRNINPSSSTIYIKIFTDNSPAEYFFILRTLAKWKHHAYEHLVDFLAKKKHYVEEIQAKWQQERKSRPKTRKKEWKVYCLIDPPFLIWLSSFCLLNV